MDRNRSHIPSGAMLPWRGAQKPAVPRGMHAWLQLPSALLQTRYRLKAVERTFGEAEEATAIQAVLRQWGTREHEFHAHYLIAQPHAGEPCYHISEYVQRCAAGELAIAERLRGRTMLHLYQTEEARHARPAECKRRFGIHRTGVVSLPQRARKSVPHRFRLRIAAVSIHLGIRT